MLVTGVGTFESTELALTGARAEEVVQSVSRHIPDRDLALLLVAAAGVWLIRRWNADDPTTTRRRRAPRTSSRH